MTKNLGLLATAVLLWPVAATPAIASTAGAPFQVSADVVGTCTVTTSEVPIGKWSPSAQASTGTVAIACKDGWDIPHSIAFNAGSGSLTQTRMANDANTLKYTLHTDIAHTIAWGEGSAGSSVVAGSASASGHSTGPDTATAALHGIYVNKPRSRTENYTDTITATVVRLTI